MAWAVTLCFLCAALASSNKVTVELEPLAPAVKPSVEEAQWTDAHNINAFLGVPEVLGVRIAIPLNVVLLGEVGEVSLEAGLELDHVVVPFGEDQVTTRPTATRSTHIRFEYDIKVHHLPAAGRMLEKMIRTTRRPDDAPGTFTVDAHRTSQTIQHLLASVGLNNTFSVVILKTSLSERYGYRSGLTHSELEALAGDLEWMRKLDAMLANKQSVSKLNPMPLAEAVDFRVGGGAAWAQWYDTTVELDSNEAQLHSLTRHMALKGSPVQVAALRESLSGNALSDCLVWSWLSSSNFAFLDISHPDWIAPASPTVHSHRQVEFTAGHALSSALRHVVSPGIAPFPIEYAESVVFTLYLLRMQAVYDPREFFSWTTFSDEMMRLAAPGQKFSFRVEEVGPEMGIAVQLALRSAVLPTEGLDSPSTVVYLDSKALRDLLKPATNGAPPTTEELRTQGLSSPSQSRRVSVVLVSTAYPYPVLVDRYFVAKSLGDMVIVSQSNFEAYHARVQCGGTPVDWDLRNPLRHALAATATHLAGLVPPHLSYSRATEAVAQEWLWSVGNSPFSHTSHGHRFSRHQATVASRNYMLYALERSIEVANAAIVALKKMHTTPSNWQAPNVVAGWASRMLPAQQALLRTWREAASDLHNVSALQDIHQQTQLFVRQVYGVIDILAAFQCTRPRGSTQDLSDFSWTPLLVSVVALDFLVLVGFFVLRYKLKKNKIKIN
jgi:hypothetical protein